MNLLLVAFPGEEFRRTVEQDPGPVLQTEVKVWPGFTVTRIFNYKETREGEDGHPLLVYKEDMRYHY